MGLCDSQEVLMPVSQALHYLLINSGRFNSTLVQAMKADQLFDQIVEGHYEYFHTNPAR